MDPLGSRGESLRLGALGVAIGRMLFGDHYKGKPEDFVLKFRAAPKRKTSAQLASFFLNMTKQLGGKIVGGD